MPKAPTQIVSFFLEKCCIPHSAVLPLTNMIHLCQIMPMFWSRCRAVATFGLINRVSATTPAHNVFCCSAVAHILTPSVYLAFRPKSGFKNKFRARAGFGLVIRTRVGFRLQNEALFVTLCGHVGRGQQGEIERIHPLPTNGKNRLKSFCEVGYANFKPNVLLLVRGYQWRFGRGGAACMMPSSIKKICSFFKKRKCAGKIFIVFVTLSDLNKTSNRAVTHTSYKMLENWCSTVRVVCTCGQCDLTFCVLQLTALIKPK